MISPSPAAGPGPLDLSRTRIFVVLNRASGRFRPDSERTAGDVLEQAGAGAVAVVAVEPDGLPAALDRAAAEAEVLAVLGGDGTARSAAARCGMGGPILVPLPGGTMNVLSRALYGAHPWPAVLRQVLADPRPWTLSGGRADGELFLISAILGVPSRWARAREALRHGHLKHAALMVRAALAHPWPDPLDYRFTDALAGEARALAVRCPLTSRALGRDAQVLEAAAIDPHSAAQALRLGVDALFGRWRTDQAVTVARTPLIQTSRKGGVPAVLDGEAMRFDTPVNIAFVPAAVRVLLPPGPQER
ncbi:MAG TPA: diacylglycerol kinase family protein [Caulobacteraceae bacterium]|jgi:diacylglycerol kinase family enzyme|nr:diacylglycerol kinase family protein [Caulobacteraceae bacterium]